MSKKPHTKKIKITSKGIVVTSRGRCRTPIGTPYMENVNTIFSMLTRDKAKIMEVLPNGKEVELTIYNFSQDNSIKEEIKPAAPVAHVADPAIVNAGTPKEETKTERPLSRKERRELERKARAEAAVQHKVEEPVIEETVAEVEEAPVTEESSAIEADAISE